MKSTRRDLLRKTVLAGTALAAINLTAACSKKEDTKHGEPSNGENPEAEAAAGYVSVDHSTAKALGYVEDGSSLGSDVRADKGTTKGADQTCNNCQFFTVDASTGGVGGKCSLFSGNLVKTQGWCRSWSIKAQA